METANTPELSVTDVSQPIWDAVGDEMFFDLPDSFDSCGDGSCTGNCTLCEECTPHNQIPAPEAAASA